MWRGYPVEGYYDTHWLMGLWSTQAKVESIVLKATWHWGSDSSVVNDSLGRTRPHTTVFKPSVCEGLHGWWLYVFTPDFVEGLPDWGL